MKNLMKRIQVERRQFWRLKTIKEETAYHPGEIIHKTWSLIKKIQRVMWKTQTKVASEIHLRNKQLIEEEIF